MRARPALAGPRLVADVAATPAIRYRAWEADEVRTQPRASAHSAVEIAWIDEGEVAYVIGRTQHPIAERSAMIVPSDVEHATLFPTSMRGAAIWVCRDVVCEIADAVGRRVGVEATRVAQSARVVRLGAALADEVRDRARGSLLAVDAIAEAMVIAALRDDPTQPVSQGGRGSGPPLDPAIATAVRFLEDAYAEPLAIADLARTVNMSRFHFSRRFRDATGKSPYRYLVDVRLERAAEMLRRRRASVTETAISVGFSDPSRFARMFRARFGVAPAVYRVKASVTSGGPSRRGSSST